MSLQMSWAVSSTEPKPRRRILLIEDNPADAHLSKVVHDELKCCSWLHTVQDGTEALDDLRGAGVYSEQGRPDVILMELQLPIKSGLKMIF